MSTRGLNFLDKRAATQLSIIARGDPIGPSDLADRLRADAEKAGISPEEINADLVSVLQLLFEVMRRRERSGQDLA